MAWEDRPESRIPLADYSNVYFIKRLAGTAFGKTATHVKIIIVYKMLHHDYWIIRNAALEAIRKHSNTSSCAGSGLDVSMAPANLASL